MIPEKAGPLLDSGFSLADIAFGAQLSSLKLAGFEIDAGRLPKTRAYSDWILARPSFAKVLDKAEGSSARGSENPASRQRPAGSLTDRKHLAALPNGIVGD